MMNPIYYYYNVSGLVPAVHLYLFTSSPSAISDLILSLYVCGAGADFHLIPERRPVNASEHAYSRFTPPKLICISKQLVEGS